MSLKTKIVFFLFLCAGSSFIMPFGSQEKSANPENKPPQIEVIGILRLVGNEPFTRFIVSGEDGKNYFLQTPEKNSLRKFIGAKIRVKGTLKTTKMTAADGKELGDENVLSNLEFVM